MEKTPKQKTVAVIGTGMAGLVTAHLLHRDPQKRYKVKLFEKKEQISLSAESVSVSVPNEKKTVWADVPMRAFAGGFYHNLIRMYDYLGVRYHSQPFLFSFTRQSTPLSNQGPHMVHASNFHQIPSIPRNLDFMQWLIEAAYTLLCYLWFTICCFLVAPLEASDSTPGESLDHYLQRIYIPRYYTANYLLPLISSVCTCSHEELMQFPASDVLEYKKRTHRQRHYIVVDGVQCVQETLLRGLDVRLGVHSTRVEPKSQSHEVEVSYIDSRGEETKEIFDLVVLAVSPDIVASMFEPLKSKLNKIPTTFVETVAHTDFSTIPPMLRDTAKSTLTSSALGVSNIEHNTGQARPQSIHLRYNDSITESIHEQPNSMLVTTNPLTPIDSSKVIRSAGFTRVLRNPESRLLINDIFRQNEKNTEENPLKSWRNGQDGVYLAGGWCWDGMVLLEGCIISAMRVAADLGVEIPWER